MVCCGEEALIVAGLLATQCVFGANIVFVNWLLALGADPLFLVVLVSTAFVAAFLPVAVAVERKKWPARLSWVLLAQILAMALGGGTLFQLLMIWGIQRTSPPVAAAMPNLAPGLIFAIAAGLGLERFDRRCRYSRAKVAGTLVCLAGATVMSLLQCPTKPPSLFFRLHGNASAAAAAEWSIGCLCLLGSILLLSLNAILQAKALVSFPAPLTLSVATAALGGAFTVPLQLAMEGRVGFGEAAAGARLSPALLAEAVVLGGLVVSGCTAYLTWCVGKKGPVFVSAFSPVQTVCSAALSATVFRQELSLGSFGGIVLMFSGLYMVLWAKKGEDECTEITDTIDVEKPLLS